MKHTPTKSASRGTLFYVKDDIIHKLTADLNIEKQKELKSVLKEILQKFFIRVCIQKNLMICFVSHSQNNLPKKTEKKRYESLGTLNMDQIRTNRSNNASEFLAIIFSRSVQPDITSSIRLKISSHTHIHNIIGNVNK